MKPLRAFAGAALLCALASAAHAQSTRFTSLTLENDFFAGYDRHYTNGVQLAFLAGPEAVVAIGQRIYTPADTDIDPPDPRDRPYAGWLYIMGDVRTRNAGTVDHLTVTIGTVGPASGAHQAQDLVHRALHESLSKGWNSQVRNKATFMAGYERAWPAVASGKIHAREWDASLRTGASVGTPITYADAGAVLRFGRNLPQDLPVTHISLGPPRDGFRGTSAPGWYVWTGIDGHAVAYNTFMEGSTFRGAASLKREPWGHDLQVGVAAAWPSTRVGFTWVQRSREFDGQRGSDRFGQLALSFAY